MLVTVLVAVTALVVAVLMHYETLRAVTAILPRVPGSSRFRMVFVILGAIIGHVAEMWVFAIAFFVLCRYEDSGQIVDTAGETVNSIMDIVYFSAVTYTTLGFGDLVPSGHVRFLTALESITGLSLIAWTASFGFLQMRRLWKDS